jgi:hypothetical protein
LTLLKVDVSVKDPRSKSTASNRRRSPAENSARIRELGFTTSKHIKMYGERFELVSDPYEEGFCTVVRVISGNDPTVRTLRLPAALLVGASDRFQKN